MPKKIQIIEYKTKSKFNEHVFTPMLDDGYGFKIIESEPNGEVEAEEYARILLQRYVYFCLEMNQYFIFYRE